ncbi:MAG: RAD55 family ATPase [Thermoplasmata archaeon]
MSLNLGIKNLDNYFPGLREGTVNLLYGPPGSGKTIIGLQFLINGGNYNEETLYISLDQAAFEVKKDFEDMDWNLDVVNVIDAVPTSKKREIAPYREVTQITEVLKMKDVSMKYQIKEIDVFNLRSTLKNILSRRNFKRIVLDSLTSLKLFYTLGVEPEEASIAFVDFLRILEESTVLIIAEDFDDLNFLMRMMDTILKIEREGNDFTLEIVKSSYILKKTFHSLLLTKSGFMVE